MSWTKSVAVTSLIEPPPKKMRNASPEERKAMMAELEKKYKEAPEV